MHKKKWIYAICLLITLLGSLAWPALAAPPIPAAFWGVLAIDETPAPDGVVVKALINGQEYASATVFTDSGQPGLYLITVPGDDPDTPGVIEGGQNGQTITFAVGGAAITETATWVSGAYLNLNLTGATEGPIASFTATPLAGTAPLTVTFTGTSTGNITGWAWDFGNGTTSALQNPPAVNYNSGAYTVTLTVTDSNNRSDTKIRANYINVTPPGSGANLIVEPSLKVVGLDEIFTIVLKVQVGSPGLDTIDSYLLFDPNYLRVVDAAGNEINQITAGTALPVVLQNSVDNSQGRIIFSAGRQLTGDPVSGDFILATIRFQAKAKNMSGTSISFLNDTDVYYQGNSILGSLQNGTVEIQNAPLFGKVTPQGRGAPPSSRWAGFPLTVTLYPPGSAVPSNSYTATIDASGYFTVSNVLPGNYDIKVKNDHTLSNKRNNIAVNSQSGVTDFYILLEGDANNNDKIRGDDYSILATAYAICNGQNGWDARADFNGDNCIRGDDYSLLATNYGLAGPIEVVGILPAETTAAENSVTISLDPSTQYANVGDVFSLRVKGQTGSGGVDVIDMLLKFDANSLQVVDSAGNTIDQIEAKTAMPVVLQNNVDNQNGQIAFSAGRQLGGTPVTGDFVLATAQFKLITATAGISVTFDNNNTAAFLAGSSILSGSEGAVISSQEQLHKVFLPIIMK